MNLSNQMEKRMEKIKPETSLKCSMNGEKSVCIYILFKEFLRLMESFFSPPAPPKKTTLGKYYQRNFFFRTQKFLFKVVFISSCIFIK